VIEEMGTACCYAKSDKYWATDPTGIAPSSLSFHLKELSHAGLAESRQQGRFVIYTARFETMNALLGYLTDNCCGGNPCTSATACVPKPASASKKSVSRKEPA